MKVNIENMITGKQARVKLKTRKWSCSGCGRGVGANYIQFVKDDDTRVVQG